MRLKSVVLAGFIIWIVHECTATSCVHPDTSLNSKVIFYANTGMASYKCDTGYELFGNRIRICENGTWSGKAPLCLTEVIQRVKYNYDFAPSRKNNTSAIELFEEVEVNVITISIRCPKMNSTFLSMEIFDNEMNRVGVLSNFDQIPSDPGSRQGGLDPGSRYAGLDPGSRQAGLDPGSRYAGLDPGSRYGGLYPGSRYAGLNPGSRYAGLDPGSRYAGLDPGSRYAVLDPPLILRRFIYNINITPHWTEERKYLPYMCPYSQVKIYSQSALNENRCYTPTRKYSNLYRNSAPFESYCYYFSSYENRMNFMEAENLCSDISGNLAFIGENNSELLSFLEYQSDPRIYFTYVKTPAQVTKYCSVLHSSPSTAGLLTVNKTAPCDRASGWICQTRPSVCGAPDSNEGTTMNIISVATITGVVEYTCTNASHKLHGLSQRHCLYTGIWSSTAPRCIGETDYNDALVIIICTTIGVLVTVVVIGLCCYLKHRKSNNEHINTSKEEINDLDADSKLRRHSTDETDSSDLNIHSVQYYNVRESVHEYEYMS